MQVLLFGGEGDAQEAHVRSLVDGLTEVGVDTKTVCQHDLDDDRYARVRCPTNGLLTHLFTLVYGTVLTTLLLLREDYDVVYTRSAYYAAVAAVLARLFGLAFVVEVNGPLFEELERKRTEYSKWEYALSYVTRTITVATYSYSDHIVAVTDRTAETVVESHDVDRSDITVVPNGVDTERFAPREVTPSDLGLPDGRYLCYVGNFTELHYVGEIIAASKPVLERHPETRLLLAGDGPSTDDLRRQARELGISDRVHFVGRVRHEAVPEYIAVSEVCLLYMEPVDSWSPLKFYEYLACGRPVVANTGLGLGVLEEVGAGTLVEPGDREAFTAGIERGLSDSGSMGRRAREYAVEECDWADRAADVAGACEAAVERNR